MVSNGRTSSPKIITRRTALGIMAVSLTTFLTSRANRAVASSTRELSEVFDPYGISQDYSFSSGVIRFGSYPQGAKEPEPIEWLVLDERESHKLLLAKYALDCRPYNEKYEDVTWESCTLRAWLNSDFLDQAFMEEERDKIAKARLVNEGNEEYGTTGGSETVDQIFLLGLAEVEEYFGVGAWEISDELICHPTDCAIRNSAYVNNAYTDNGAGGCLWWLRSPGCDSSYAALVGSGGGVNALGDFVDSGNIAVRPALWVSGL